MTEVRRAQYIKEAKQYIRNYAEFGIEIPEGFPDKDF